MNPGLAVFIASDALGAVVAVIACCVVARLYGRGAAVKAGGVMGLSVAAYTAVCLWLGFGLGAEFLASVAAVVVPLPAAAILAPSLEHHTEGDH